MDTLSLFLQGHARAHSRTVAQDETVGSTQPDQLYKELADAEARTMPLGMNSVAWITWHLARCEDAAMATVTGTAQVLDEGDWLPKLGIQIREIGTNMTKAQVAELSAAIDLEALCEYRNAVGRRTREIAQRIEPALWDETVPVAAVERIAQEGAFGPGAEWVVKVWTGRSRSWFFDWLGIAHNLLHLGQAKVIRSLVKAGHGR